MALTARHLQDIEARLDALAASLLAGSPEPLERQAMGLHQALLAVGKPARGEVTPPALRQRLASCMERFGQIRLNLARRAAATDRELGTLLPQANPVTYQPLGLAFGGRKTGARYS